MNYEQYQQLFDEILNSNQPVHPYDDPMYLKYTRLNQARMRRREKQLVLDDHLVKAVKDLKEPQHWIILTEPWCGDAAHTLPAMIALAGQSPMITYDIQLRDTEPFLIDSYLTGTSKSIPKLIARDQNGKDLFTWGPRPAQAQQIVIEMKATYADHESISEALQQWYNQDKGVSFCREFLGWLAEAR